MEWEEDYEKKEVREHPIPAYSTPLLSSPLLIPYPNSLEVPNLN